MKPALLFIVFPEYFNLIHEVFIFGVPVVLQYYHAKYYDTMVYQFFPHPYGWQLSFSYELFIVHMPMRVSFKVKNTFTVLTLQIGGHEAADINSAKLEEKFLTNDKDVVEFTAGSQSYSLSFQGKQRIGNHAYFCMLKYKIGFMIVVQVATFLPLRHDADKQALWHQKACL